MVLTRPEKTIRKNTQISRFQFKITLTDEDSKILYEIKNILNCGYIYHYKKRKKNWKPEVTYQILSIKDHLETTIPFFEKYHLNNTLKKKQFEKWKKELLNYIGA